MEIGNDMCCEKTQRRLSEYLDGALPGEESRRLKEHLKRCNRCARELESLRRTVDMVHDLPTVPAPDNLVERVADELEERTEYSRIMSLGRRAMAVAAGFVVVAMAVFLVNDGTLRGPAPKENRKVVGYGADVAEMTGGGASELKRDVSPTRERPVGTDGELDEIRAGLKEQKRQRQVPHQIVRLEASEDDGQLQQTIKSAREMGLIAAHIDVQEGGTVIVMKMEGQKYENFLSQLLREQDAPALVRNAPIAGDKVYFKRLAERYSRREQAMKRRAASAAGDESDLSRAEMEKTAKAQMKSERRNADRLEERAESEETARNAVDVEPPGDVTIRIEIVPRESDE